MLTFLITNYVGWSCKLTFSFMYNHQLSTTIRKCQCMDWKVYIQTTVQDSTHSPTFLHTHTHTHIHAIYSRIFIDFKDNLFIDIFQSTFNSLAYWWHEKHHSYIIFKPTLNVLQSILNNLSSHLVILLLKLWLEL